ncbi:hypothetical protein [Sphaerospermopsis sp. LEGE 08334]|uniref:hypothetical protein n=1 Tax=Sphaerospermopsis sp. LEGE 08334 TaxID=1828651 RepID=UPI00187EB181|nr:hypothetical protein [Sphaerospermopsis sp. LEGE 08334]
MSRILGFTGFNKPRRHEEHEGRREEEGFLERCTTFLSLTQRRKGAKEVREV